MEFPRMMYLRGDVTQWVMVDDAAQQKKAAKAGYLEAPTPSNPGDDPAEPVEPATDA